MSELADKRAAAVEARLREALQPAYFLLKDQSHLHAGHAGAKGGLSHFDAHIISHEFEGLSRIRRHQKVYGILGDLMKTDIHALSLKTETPGETENQPLLNQGIAT